MLQAGSELVFESVTSLVSVGVPPGPISKGMGPIRPLLSLNVTPPELLIVKLSAGAALATGRADRRVGSPTAIVAMRIMRTATSFFIGLSSLTGISDMDRAALSLRH